MGTAKLEWPAGLRRSPLRDAWFRSLRAQPVGLTLRDLAGRLGEPYPRVAFWARLLKYPCDRQPRGRKSSIDWDSVDWSRRNCELARELGVTAERVRQIRAARKQPPIARQSPDGIKFRRFVRANRQKLQRWSIRQMIVLAGVGISTATAHVILRQADARLRQHRIPWQRVNWKLGNREIAAAWATTPGYVAKVRAARREPEPTWDGHPCPPDSARRRAIAEERAKARGCARLLRK